MPTIVHFDIAADDPERAKNFYEDLFAWKFVQTPGMPYYLIETTDLVGNKGVAGGLGKRGAPYQRISNFVGVESIEEYSAKVVELGGEVVQPKMAVPGWGYMAICTDTEGNSFGLWEENSGAM
jgi:predicted enzyme related to lactoylglutathione lyase